MAARRRRNAGVHTGTRPRLRVTRRAQDTKQGSDLSRADERQAPLNAGILRRTEARDSGAHAVGAFLQGCGVALP